jgi:sugar/nucleoside kinase (ribokinase family)
VTERTPRTLFAGKLSRDFIIFPDGRYLLDVPGGNVLYAAIGYLLWEDDPPPGLISRVGEDYPREWIDEYAALGLNIRGINYLPQAVDVRSFLAYSDSRTLSTEDPVTHFARLEVPFPKTLLGYRSGRDSIDSRTKILQVSIRIEDIPEVYLDATSIHLCPLDYMTQSLLPALLRQKNFTTVTLDPSAGYMNPTFWHDLPALLSGLTAFLPSEEEVRELFSGRSDDLWEMAETLASFGPEMVVIKRGEKGQYLYDAGSKTRWAIPSYNSRFDNPIGAGDAFCGGFLAGYFQTYEPLDAALHGNITASLVVEGNTPEYALEAMPGLAQARLDALKGMIRRV